MKDGKLVNVTVTTDVFVEQDGDGFHGYVPALKGLHVDGMTVTETLQAVGEAMECYLESIAKHDDPLPGGIEINFEEREQVTHTWAMTNELGTSLRTLQLNNLSQPSNEMDGLRT